MKYFKALETDISIQIRRRVTIGGYKKKRTLGKFRQSKLGFGQIPLPDTAAITPAAGA
ncbi:MAG TPA: hypothetical protein VJ698_14760 [Noviherbaspirillum sp.]|uniref:hypothetical protein n=1 Tax=Noviherbaspirillum sp. TaxID=1926288 RepID=UPI002B482F45|nr:hypothetical protein [Noviherbaspirillum sp.]HJV86730.1 hypothetical protein [Noviherbaspirillum sp.]